MFNKKSIIPRIALKNIIVYKILIKESNNLFFYTPITGDKIVIGKTYKGIFRFSKYYPKSLIKSLFSKCIASGYIHSFKDKEYHSSNYNSILVKCIIPKGTLYFIGKDDDIASRKLKYVEIIK